MNLSFNQIPAYSQPSASRTFLHQLILLTGASLFTCVACSSPVLTGRRCCFFADSGCMPSARKHNALTLTFSLSSICKCHAGYYYITACYCFFNHPVGCLSESAFSFTSTLSINNRQVLLKDKHKTQHYSDFTFFLQLFPQSFRPPSCRSEFISRSRL